MDTHLRKSGIDILGDIPWGTHFCHFYQTKNDLLELLIPYFKAGLENNEYCIWITANPITEDEALKALSQAVPEFKSYVNTKSFAIKPYLDWYLKSGEFDAERIQTAWDKELEVALTRGFQGMRVNGNETWLSEQNRDSFMQYEKKLNNAIANKNILVLCTYPLDNTKAEVFLDIAHAHECIVSRREGRWEVLEEPQLKKKKAELLQENQALDALVAERTRALNELVSALQTEIELHRHTAENLRREKQLSNEILDSIPALVVLIDKDFHYLRWNKNFERAIGISSEELKNVHAVEAFFPDPDSRRKTYSLLEESYRFGEASGDVTPIFPGGIKTTYHVTALRIMYQGLPCILCLGADITDRKKAEDELRLAYQRLSYHVANTPLGLIEWNKDLKTTRWSEQAERIFGWTESEMLGKHLYDPIYTIIHPENLGVVREATNMLWHGTAEKIQVLNKNITKEKKVITCEWYNSTLRDEQGQVLTVMSLVQDVTERIQAQEKINESYRHIRSLSEYLQNVREDERTRIAREIHDELGQRLTVLKMNVGLLRSKLTTEDGAMSEKLQELTTLIDSTVSAVRRISAELRPSLLDDMGLVAAMSWHLKEFQKHTGINTRFQEPDELELSDMVKTGLFRILQESLTNVARYSHASNVNVSLRSEDGWLLLTIADDGVGFEPDRVMQKGTLGILGMKERAAMIGGLFNIDSAPGKGTEVRVHLPIYVNNQ